MKDTMGVTVEIGKNEVACFTIEFLRADFFTVIEEVSKGLTLESVQNNPLWEIV